MLQRMATARKDDQFDVEEDNEFEQVRKLLKRKKQLKEKKEEI